MSNSAVSLSCLWEVVSDFGDGGGARTTSGMQTTQKRTHEMTEEVPDEPCSDKIGNGGADVWPDEVGILERGADDEDESAGEGRRSQHKRVDEALHALRRVRVGTVTREFQPRRPALMLGPLTSRST